MKSFLSLHFMVVLLIVSLVSACATNTDYLQSTTIPPITPSDENDKNRLGELYPVPKVDNVKTPKAFDVPKAPTLAIQSDGNIASSQKMGGSQWVTYTKPLGEAWTQLNTFFQIRQIPIVTSDLSSVIMVTDWFQLAVQPGYKIRYLVQVDEGLQADTSDIFLYNQKIKTGENPVSAQPPLAISDPKHATLLADELVKSLNKYNERIGGSYLATTINLPKKIQLTEIDEEPVLSSIASVDRLNRALSNALSEDDFINYGRDIKQDVYHFNVIEDGQVADDGWFKNLLSSKPSKTSPISLDEILANLSSDPEVLRLFSNLQSKSAKNNTKAPGFLLVMRKQNQQTIIYLRDSKGKKLPIDDTRNILDLIRSSLQ